MEWFTPQTIINGLTGIIWLFIAGYVRSINQYMHYTHKILVEHISDHSIHKG